MAHEYRVEFNDRLPLAAAHADSFVFPQHAAMGVAAETDAFAADEHAQQAAHQHHHDPRPLVDFHGHDVGMHFLHQLGHALEGTDIGHHHFFSARFADYHVAF